MTNIIEIKVGYNEQSKGWVGEASVKLIQEYNESIDFQELKREVKELADELADEVQQKSNAMTLRKGGL